MHLESVMWEIVIITGTLFEMLLYGSYCVRDVTTVAAMGECRDLPPKRTYYDKDCALLIGYWLNIMFGSSPIKT